MAKSTISDDSVRDQDKFMLRLPNGMRDRIKAIADKNNRSMNAEIVATLEDRYPATFSFDTFYEQFILPIVKEQDEEKKAALAVQADAVIKTGDPDLSVWLELGADGRSGVAFGQKAARYFSSANTLPPAADDAPQEG